MSYLEIPFMIAFSLVYLRFWLLVVFPVAAAEFKPEMTAFQSLFEGEFRFGFVRSSILDELKHIRTPNLT